MISLINFSNHCFGQFISAEWHVSPVHIFCRWNLTVIIFPPALLHVVLLLQRQRLWSGQLLQLRRLHPLMIPDKSKQVVTKTGIVGFYRLIYLSGFQSTGVCVNLCKRHQLRKMIYVWNLHQTYRKAGTLFSSYFISHKRHLEKKTFQSIIKSDI